MPVEFEDYSIQVKEKLDEAAEAFLYEAAELLKTQAAQASPVKSGQLKGSWNYIVDTGKMEAMVGSPLENSIWNEFGTGEYALHGDGRKGGWKYQDDEGNWHFTMGKKPRRTLFQSFMAKKSSIKKRAKMIFSERIG